MIGIEDATAEKARPFWTTVASKAVYEMVEKKSRFIGICEPVSTPVEAEAFVERCRRDHPQATHCVFAWQVVHPQVAGRYSDDGEPSGTAGRPVMDVLCKRGVDQAALVVIRYFGGILLGAGGLVRAYTKAAAGALEEAKPLVMRLQCKVKVTVSYPLYDRVSQSLEKAGFQQEPPLFQERVNWIAFCPPQERQQLQTLCEAASAGQAQLESAGVGYAPG